jgi:hypothetical protein
MQSIVIGHGWHDGTEKVLVPDGMQLDFFTREDSPMLMTNLLALLRAGELGIPLDGASGGQEVPNYSYDAFTDEQLARAMQLDHTDPIEAEVYFIPAATNLCTDLANCPALGPHACDGLLGVAAQNGYTHLQLLTCRVNTDDPQPATHELMGDHGEPDTTVDDQFVVWVRSFLGLSPAEQDTAWEDLDHETQVHLADDGEMIDWARCYEARAAMRAAADPTEAAAIAAALDAPVKLRLFRDYPDYRHLLADNVELSAEELDWINQQFLPQDFLTQVALWISFGEEQQLRYLAHPQMVNWTAAYHAWDYFQLGMEAEYLADVIQHLDDANRARLRSQDDLVAHMGAHAGVLN